MDEVESHSVWVTDSRQWKKKKKPNLAVLLQWGAKLSTHVALSSLVIDMVMRAKPKMIAISKGAVNMARTYSSTKATQEKVLR